MLMVHIDGDSTLEIQFAMTYLMNLTCADAMGSHAVELVQLLSADPFVGQFRFKFHNNACVANLTIYCNGYT